MFACVCVCVCVCVHVSVCLLQQEPCSMKKAANRINQLRAVTGNKERRKKKGGLNRAQTGNSTVLFQRSFSTEETHLKYMSHTGQNTDRAL